MGLNLRKVEIRQLLQSDEDIALFLDEAYQEGGSELFMNCLEIIVREVGMSIISKNLALVRKASTRPCVQAKSLVLRQW